MARRRRGWLWTWIGIPVVAVIALWFTLRTGVVQIRMLPAMFRSIMEKAQTEQGAKGDSNSLSAFQAFVISAAARVGTGNVSGVDGAIFIGSVITVELAWSIAGVSMVAIAYINLAVIAVLAPTVLRLLRDYRTKVARGVSLWLLSSS